MEETRSCNGCDYSTAEALARGEGRPRTAKRGRWYGWVLIVDGGFLVALMAVVTVMNIHAGTSALGLFAMAIALGLTFLAVGVRLVQGGKIGNMLRMFRIVLLPVVFVAIWFAMRAFQ